MSTTIITSRNDERRFGIPDDWVPPLPGAAIMTANVPPIWSIDERFPKIWEQGITGKEVRVSVHDTAAGKTHPNLPNPVFTRNLAGGSNGDPHGHGTHCAGTVLGRDGVGCAPEADLMLIKVLSDRGGGSSTDINEARRIAAAEGADVLSESLGGAMGGESDRQSIVRAYENGVLLDVAAAGNAGYNGRNTIGYPGRWLETWCIGAYNRNGRISGFSSGGREIDCACPGEQIVSCRTGGGFTTMSGTSMATPWWAGFMALVIHKRRILGWNDLIGAEAWRRFFDQQGFWRDAGEPGKDVRYGRGIPNIDAILDWLVEPLYV